MNNAIKNFDILATSLNVLHNYFNSLTNYFSNPANIFDLSAKPFFPCADITISCKTLYESSAFTFLLKTRSRFLS